MNLYIRLLAVLIASWFKTRLPAAATSCNLVLRVLPNDIDINMHMNNGRYLTICDLTRVDLFLRTGLVTTMRKHRWMPIIAEHTMVYHKPLRLFAMFRVSIELSHWDAKYFYMTHLFTQGTRVIATGTSKGVVRGIHGVVPPEQVIEAINKVRNHDVAIAG
ncbi:MAG: acyl-CoA thioesterase [Acidiferrobacteraceae bacterium]